jgi:hypothetical protein
MDFAQLRRAPTHSLSITPVTARQKRPWVLINNNQQNRAALSVLNAHRFHLAYALQSGFDGGYMILIAYFALAQQIPEPNNGLFNENILSV